MPDDFDRVQELNDRHLSDALDAHFRKQATGAGREICIDCDEPIPLPRRQAAPHCTRCIDCQQLLEFKQRRV